MHLNPTAPRLTGLPVALESWPVGALWRLWLRTGAALARRAWDQPALWRRRSRERWYLIQLGHRELQDLGLTHADARREAAKPFWRA